MIDIDDKEDGEIPPWPHPKALEKMRAARQRGLAKIAAEREAAAAREAAEKRKEIEKEKCKKLLMILTLFISSSSTQFAPKF